MLLWWDRDYYHFRNEKELWEHFYWYIKNDFFELGVGECFWVNFDGVIGFNLEYALPSPFDFTDPLYQPGPHCAGHRIPETELVF